MGNLSTSEHTKAFALQHPTERIAEKCRIHCAAQDSLRHNRLITEAPELNFVSFGNKPPIVQILSDVNDALSFADRADGHSWRGETSSP